MRGDGRLGECRGFIQHGDVSVHDHVVSVACQSCRMADALARVGVCVDRPSLVRGALLYDYFLYDWHVPDPSHRLNGFRHLFFALANVEPRVGRLASGHAIGRGAERGGRR